MKLFDTNVVGTYNLLETLEPHASRIKRFVLASTDNVYWNPNGALYLPVDEEHPRINDDPYGMSKILCEDMCWVYMRRCGLPVTVPRFGVTLACEELLDPDVDLGRQTLSARLPETAESQTQLDHVRSRGRRSKIWRI